jgi:hypothetical protein
MVVVASSKPRTVNQHETIGKRIPDWGSPRHLAFRSIGRLCQRSSLARSEPRPECASLKLRIPLTG